jgi:hypothetical protein
MGITAVHDIRVTVTDITDVLLPGTVTDQTTDVLTDTATDQTMDVLTGMAMDLLIALDPTDMDPVTAILHMDTAITPIRITPILMAEAIRIIRTPNPIIRATGTTIS